DVERLVSRQALAAHADRFAARLGLGRDLDRRRPLARGLVLRRLLALFTWRTSLAGLAPLGCLATIPRLATVTRLTTFARPLLAAAAAPTPTSPAPPSSCLLGRHRLLFRGRTRIFFRLRCGGCSGTLLR